MSRRKRTRSEALTVRAIFDPAGDIHVRAVAPSGNVYEIKPRASFQIASEDVDWFFNEWETQHRQCLSSAEEYRPRRAQFDNGEANRKARVIVEPEPVIELAPVVEPESEPELGLVVEPEPNIDPEPVVEADAGDDGDKE